MLKKQIILIIDFYFIYKFKNKIIILNKYILLKFY